jgi:gliding motility-associated-like protein
MLFSRICFFVALFLFKQSFFSQTVVVDNTIFTFSPGSVFFSNGGVEIRNNSQFTNDGSFTVTKNSTLDEIGNFIINTNATVSGNGFYKVEQDWINDAQFNCGTSTVELFGNTQQLLKSNSNISTTFNNLILTGTGVANNRKKTLVTCDIFIGNNGNLNINDRELETQTNSFIVNNGAVNSVSNSLSFGQEGFVSSIQPGAFRRKTNSGSSYLFPVGSSNGTLRYRPVVIAPFSSSNNEFGVRMNNYDSNIDGYNRSVTDGFINIANAEFYHSISQPAGNDNVNLSIFYSSNDDGSWGASANWENSWNTIQGSNSSLSTNYSEISSNSWNIKNFPDPYILVNLQEQLEIPNIFTPNGDGANDVFLIDSKNILNLNLTILNRWGQVVFETTDINTSWNGYFNGSLCTEGTYFYFITGNYTSFQVFSKQGFLQLEY